MGVSRHVEAEKKQGGEWKLELEEKQEGDKWWALANTYKYPLWKKGE